MNTVTEWCDSKRIFAYDLYPIDFWRGWTTPQEFVEASLREWQPSTGLEYMWAADLCREIHSITALAAPLLRGRFGWRGDGNWRICPIPLVPETGYMLAVKQNHSGRTFVVSPVRLPWLSEYDMVSMSLATLRKLQRAE